MSATAAEYYFRFCVCWCRCFQKVAVYQQTNFSWPISIYGWDITTSVFLNKHPPYWNSTVSTSGLDFDNITVIGMLFCIRQPNFIQIGPPTAEIWRHIDFQDGGRSRSVLPVLYLLMSLPSEGQNLSENQISSTNLNSLLRYSLFRFAKKQTSAVLEFYFRYQFRSFYRNWHVILVRLPNFVQIASPTVEMWRHIDF